MLTLPSSLPTSFCDRVSRRDALRIGAVPQRGLEHLAVGLDRLEGAIDEELDMVASGHGKFKAVRGEYGAGKTFFSRWLEHRAREKGFATALVQISETDTPLYRMETIYRRALEVHRGLSSAGRPSRAIVLVEHARLLKAMQRYPEARKTYAQVIAFAEESYGPNDPTTQGYRQEMLDLISETAPSGDTSQ